MNLPDKKAWTSLVRTNIAFKEMEGQAKFWKVQKGQAKFWKVFNERQV